MEAIVGLLGSASGKDILSEESASSTTPEEVAVRCSLTFKYTIERPEETIERPAQIEAQPARRDRE
jgi:hypothetical protein